MAGDFSHLPLVMTVADCAREMRCSESTVYRAVQDGTLRATSTTSGASKRLVRIARSSFLEWLGVAPASGQVAS